MFVVNETTTTSCYAETQYPNCYKNEVKIIIFPTVAIVLNQTMMLNNNGEGEQSNKMLELYVKTIMPRHTCTALKYS